MATKQQKDCYELIKLMYETNAFTIKQIASLTKSSPYLVRNVLSELFGIKQERTGTREKTSAPILASELLKIKKSLQSLYGIPYYKIAEVFSSLKRCITYDSAIFTKQELKHINQVLGLTF